MKGLADKETNKILSMPNAGKRVPRVVNAAQIEEKVAKTGHKLRRLFYNFTVTKTSRMCLLMFIQHVVTYRVTLFLTAHTDIGNIARAILY